MVTKWGRNYQLNELKNLWAPIYEETLTLLGSTGIILPLGDPDHGKPDAATFKTVGEEQVVFTWSEAISAWDTPFNLTSSDSYQGIIPKLKFNGTDEEADSPDAALWSRDDAGGANPFSIGAWFNCSDVSGSPAILAKFDITTGLELREWMLQVQPGGEIRFAVIDESVDLAPIRDSDTGISLNTWCFVVATYDSTGGATAMTGATIYSNGALFASTAVEQASYVAMEDTNTVVSLGYYTGASAIGGLFVGYMAGGPLGPFFTQTELTADAVKRLYNLGRAALGV